MIESDDKIDLSEVFYDLDRPHLIRSKRENTLLHKFCRLLGLKPSFGSKVHTEFKKLAE